MTSSPGQPGMQAGKDSPAARQPAAGPPAPGQAGEPASWPGAAPPARWFLHVQARPPRPAAGLPPDHDGGPGHDGQQDSRDDRWADARPPVKARPAGLLPPASGPQAGEMLLPGAPRPAPAGAGRRGVRARRPAARTAAPAVVLFAVAVLAVALITGYGPKLGQLAVSQDGKPGPGGPPSPPAPAALPAYPGQQQRGVVQAISRIVAWGSTIVTTGSQASDGVVRQQFFASADGGRTWHLAPVRMPGGGQPPLGHAAVLLAGGPHAWMAEGPQAIWLSRDGLAWTLAAAHGITPRHPGDSVWVVTRTARGFLAAGAGTAGRGGSQAVIWTSRDGLAWQRMTAAQLGLAAPGETVLNISYATWQEDATVISGEVARGRESYAAAWLSADGGTAWTRVTIPAGHGAGNQISGLGMDGSGLIAVRPGRSAAGAADGVAYFSADGRAWQYAATIGAGRGWTPGVVKGSGYGFVVTGTSSSGQIMAYTSAGAGTAWQPTALLGSAHAESVVSAAAAPGGAAIAVGYHAAGKDGQHPVFLEAGTAGRARPVPLTAIPGGIVPELAVNGLAVAGGEQVAVGGADGYPAVWRKAPGRPWQLASSLGLAAASPALRALTSVTRGPAGWLAVGAPGPVIWTSAGGTTWQEGPGGITADLAGVTAVAAAAGPAGYVIAGKLAGPGGSCAADVWWSPDLTRWTRAHDVNLAAGSSQVLAVAASAHGFIAAGSHEGRPAVWTTADGVSWTTIMLPAPAGAQAAVLQQIAIRGDLVAALGQAATAAGTVPFAEQSADGGATWRQEPFSAPGPGAAFTALAASPGGFTAAGLSGRPGRRDAEVWTSVTGAAWMLSQTGGPGGAGAAQITALAAAGSAVTGIWSIATQQGQRFVSART